MCVGGCGGGLVVFLLGCVYVCVGVWVCGVCVGVCGGVVCVCVCVIVGVGCNFKLMTTLNQFDIFDLASGQKIIMLINTYVDKFRDNHIFTGSFLNFLSFLSFSLFF